MRSPSVTAMTEQGQFLVELPSSPAREPGGSAAEEEGTRARRWDIHLPSLRGRRPGLTSSLTRSAREERAQEREKEREAASVEAAMQTFFETPAGRARLAYKRGHRLFQYELEVNGLSPTAIPGPIGSPSRVTTDPVDILNSVTVEGWKLVTGKFINSEVRGGAVGVYLFKRSQKRRLSMNNPWQA